MEKPSSPWGERRETTIILNPTAHNVPKRERLNEADRYLLSQGWLVTYQETTGPGDAIGIAGRAAEAGLPLVFVCGGDGTLSEVANGLAGARQRWRTFGAAPPTCGHARWASSAGPSAPSSRRLQANAGR